MRPGIAVGSSASTPARDQQDWRLEELVDDRRAELVDVFKIQAASGSGWVRSVDATGPLVTADAEEAQQYAERGQATGVANALNRRRKVQWRVVGVRVAPGGPKRFDPTNAVVRSLGNRSS